MNQDLKARMLKPRQAGTVPVPIEGLGTVHVRGLSRSEALLVQEQDGSRGYDAMTISLGFVDPTFTFEEALELQDVSLAGELEPATDKIAELSRITKQAAKAAYKHFEENPDAEFRVLPSPGAASDGDRSAGADD